MIRRTVTLHPTAHGGVVNLADVFASFVERTKHSYLRCRSDWGYHTTDGSYVPWPWEECAEFQESETCGRLDGFVWVVFIWVRGAKCVEVYSVHKTRAEADAALATMRSEALKCTAEMTE